MQEFGACARGSTSDWCTADVLSAALLSTFSAFPPALNFGRAVLASLADSPSPPTQAEGCFQAFPSFYLPMEPEDLRPPHDIRVKRFASRLQHLLNSPHTHCTKATLDGKLVGITIWHKPGAPVFNLKRRLPLEGREVTEEEEESWKGVDQGKWEEVWGGWDKVREDLMKGQPHW